MTGRVLRPIIYAALLLFIAVATVIAVCAGTPFGSHWLIRQAVQFSGQPLAIERIEGTLLGGLTLDGIDYRSATAAFSAETLALQWRPLGLLTGELALTDVKGRRFTIDLPAADTEDAEDKSGVIEFPDLALGLSLGRSKIDTLTVTRGGETYQIDSLQLAGAIDATRISIKQLDLRTPDYGFSLTGRLSTRQPRTLHATIRWYAGEADQPTAAGQAETDGTLTDFEFTHTLQEPLTVQSNGRLQWQAEGPVIKADSRLPEQSLERVALPGWTLKESHLHTEGWIDNYDWTAQLGMEHAKHPSAKGTAKGQGDLSEITLDAFNIETLDGDVSGSGRLAWMPRLEWRAQIDGKALNPEPIAPRWKGRVRFSARNSGHYDYATQRVSVNTRQLDLDGRLGEHDLSAGGGFDISGDAVEAHRLNLHIGGNRFSFNGSLSDDPGRIANLAWDVDAGDLSTMPLPPDIAVAGRLKGKGHVGGVLKNPRVTAQMSGTGITYGNVSAETIQLNASHTNTGRHTLRVTAGDLTFNARKIRDSELIVTGTPSDHSIELRIKSESLDASVAVRDGALDLQPNRPWQWRAIMQQLDIQTGYAGDWSLQNDSKITLSPARLAIEQNCLKSGDAHLCARARWSPQNGFDVNGDIRALPLSLLHPFIAANTQLEGDVNGGFTVTGAGDSRQARLELNSPPGRFIISDADGDTVQYAWRRLNATAEHDSGVTRTRVDFDLAELGRIHADAALAADNRLDGNLRASVEDIGWLESLLPRLRGLTGSLQARATLSGTPADPRIDARISMQKAAADVPALGISVTDFTATVEGQDNRFRIESSAYSGPGRLNAEGRLRLEPDMQYALDMTIAGEAFEVLNLPRATVQVTPAINFNLTPSTAEASGKVLLPSAHVNIKTMPTSAVSVSPDARIVDQSSARADADRLRAVTANLKLKLGEDVHFNGLGLQTRLSGELDLTETPGQPPLAYGELTVVEGHYKAYGQKLRIDGGQLIFQGPYDNPALNVRAVRETPDATVGLRISGTPKQPRSEIFSEPPLPESEAIALLLTGRSLSSASESDANMLINAVASLGMARGQGITQQIAQTFNLDQVRLQAGSGFEEGSLLLGKHLSPRLYVEYAVGLFNQAGQLNLEYALTESLKLEAQSGDERSMDLMYRIER